VVVTAGPETSYARSEDGTHVAYQIIGDGPLDLVSVGYGNVVSIDMRDEEPHVRRFEERLASFSRLIRFDPRGIGLSDAPPPGVAPGIELVVDDILAVLDTVGSARACLFAVGSSGLAALLAAAMHPARVSSLALLNCYARLPRDEDYPCGIPQRLLTSFVDSVLDVSAASASDPAMDDVHLLAPSLSGDPGFRAWWARAGRRGASPAAARANLEMSFSGDVRSALPSIDAPVLILHRDPSLFSVGHAHYLADHLSHAQLVVLPGGDHLPYGADSDIVIDEIEEFLTGVRGGVATDRVLTTVLFTDIVGSTERAARSGDRSWHELLDSHDAMARGELRRFRGREVKTTGDGILATFDGPARAIRCAQSICAGARQLSLEVRAGLHTGEVEVRGDDVGGIAVHLAQRVSSHAGPNEVFVSRTVVDLVAGSGLEFEDRGVHELKGIDGMWGLFAVRG
jgi:class 3 adenylate cyclase/alpha-beta hydrolase superfamily lysophospholipase